MKNSNRPVIFKNCNLNRPHPCFKNNNNQLQQVVFRFQALSRQYLSTTVKGWEGLCHSRVHMEFM